MVDGGGWLHGVTVICELGFEEFLLAVWQCGLQKAGWLLGHKEAHKPGLGVFTVVQRPPHTSPT